MDAVPWENRRNEDQAETMVGTFAAAFQETYRQVQNHLAFLVVQLTMTFFKYTDDLISPPLGLSIVTYRNKNNQFPRPDAVFFLRDACANVLLQQFWSGHES